MEVKETKLCIECNKRPANHWKSNFCEECFEQILEPKKKVNER